MEKSFSSYRLRNEELDSDSEVYEGSVSRSGDMPLPKEDELEGVDFEECSLNEDSFNESVKSKCHSTTLFTNVNTIVPPSDDEDVGNSSGDKYSSAGEIKSKNCNDEEPVCLISSPENSPVFVRRYLKQRNRIIDSESEDDLCVESFSEKCISVCDSNSHNISDKSVNKNDSKNGRNSHAKNEPKQDVMGPKENKNPSTSVENVVVNNNNKLSKSVSDKSASKRDITIGTNVSTSLSTGINVLNKTEENTNSGCTFDNETRKCSTQAAVSCNIQDKNLIVSSAVEVKSNNSQNSDLIIINSDSDENDVQHHSDKSNQKLKEKTLEDCLQSLKISTTQGTNSGAPDMFSKEVLGNDLASRAQSLLAEDTRLKLQIAEVLKAVGDSKAILRTVNIDALPDKGLRLHKNLCRQEDQLRELRHQQSILTSEISKLPDSAIKMCQQMNSKQQTAINNNKERHSVHPVWSKLPTSTTSIADLGKRALETHRIQQALTMDALKTLHKSLETCPSPDTMAEDPEELLVELMPHQKHALSWLLWREKQKPSGGILADDMGLGKTLTMISLVLKSNEEKLKENKNGEEETDDEDVENEENTDNWIGSSKEKKMRKGKTLVVCPATLLGQWESEISRRVQPGVLDVELHHGTNREKKARRLARRDIVITTYNIIMRDLGEVGSKNDGKPMEKGPLFRIRWERVILDEAHQVRNYKSKTAIAVCNLRAKYRWAMTGTPVHNKELDLFALLKFLRCSPFDDLNVWRKWVDNRDAAGSQRLNTLTKSLMLRRTKKDLQAKGSLQTLKDKSESLIYVKLDDEELKVYKKMLDFSKTLLAQYLYQKAEKADMLSNMPVSTNVNRYLNTVENPFENHPELARLHQRIRNMPDVKSHEVLVLLLRLRQICCHPSLITSMLDKDICQNDGIEDVDGLDLDLMDRMNALALDNDAESESGSGTRKMTFLSPDNPVFAEDRLSSKVRCMLSCLQEKVLCTNDKVVIVSQWTSMLNVIHSILQSQRINCALLTGSVPVRQRMVVVDDFNREHHGPKVLLLSLTAGGVGLNLVGANHLMLLDLHWNPQLETQACDRVYRVGQKKSVKIYKFVCSETIEENILKLQEKKLALADNVLTGAKYSQTSKLTLDDLKMLFNIA